MKDFHYVTEALQAGTDCIWSLLDKEGANNVDDVLALLATGQTIADEALGRLTAADALAELAEKIVREYNPETATFDCVPDPADAARFCYELVQDALRKYREAMDGC